MTGESPTPRCSRTVARAAIGVAAWSVVWVTATFAALLADTPLLAAERAVPSAGSALAVELCPGRASEDCAYHYIPRGDHYYVMPGNDGVRERWHERCGQAGQRSDRGLPDDARADLRDLDQAVLQRWVAHGGALNATSIRTITFCGFRLTNILELDWSAADARVRFFLTEIARRPEAENDEPHGIFPSRGLFSSGLTIDRSILSDGADVQDTRFGSFVEIERSVVLQPFVARNTVVEGALRLRDNRFEHHLRLEALEVAGDTILSNNSFPAEIPAAVLEPDGTTGSVVRLRELRLRGVLQITDNVFAGSARASVDAMAKDPAETVTRSFYLQKSIVSDNDVTLAGNRFADHVFLVDVEGKRLSIVHNVFDGLLHVTGSNFFAVRTFHNDFNSFVQLRTNQLDSSLIIDRDTFWGRPKRVEIVGNTIAQEMRVAPRRLPPEGGILAFTHNRVTGPADLYLPLAPRHVTTREANFTCDELDPDGPRPDRDGFERWRGAVDMTGSQFASGIMIAESCYRGPTSAMEPIVHPLGHIRAELARWRDETPCRDAGSAASGTSFNFSLMSAALLTLNVMPGGCDYVWRGTNLAFGYFGTSYEGKLDRLDGDTGQAGYDRATELELLQAWLLNLDHDDPGVYLGISDYLRNRGDFTGSREWLAEAKEAMYRPGLRPSLGWSANAHDDTPPADQPSWAQWLDQQVVYWALMPAGYGAMPERVIKSLAILWLGSWLVYSAHWLGWINTLYVGWRQLRGAGPAQACHAALAAQRAWSKRRRELAAAEPEQGTSLTTRHGFVATQPDQTARRFSLWSYALDATLPIIPLGRVDAFSPDNAFVRGFGYLHHILAWWLGALFIGALTIL